MDVPGAHSIEATILTTLTVAIFLGMTAQVVAERFRLPAILPLLALGMLAGTSRIGLGWVQADSLGHVLEVFIHLGVAVILFEGGLSLDLRQLAKVGGAVRNLLTIGVVVTGIGAAVVAHWATGVPWPTAALFGAIVTVTGPTVVAPLLRHMIAPRQLKTVLLSEGLIIDPIGVVLAYLVLQWIELSGVPQKEFASEIILLSATGAAVGFLAGSVARAVTRTRLVSGELRNLVVLALLMICYLVSENQAHQSGVLAAVVMGMTMSGSEIPDLVSLKTFKEQLTTLIISVLFILLSAQLDVDAMLNLGWGGVAVVAGLILVVRPLSVLLSVWQKPFGWKERFLLGMTAPRGIVAAAFASLAARQLTRSGLEGGSTLEGLVYLVILTTCAWATLMAIVLPGALGYKRDPLRRLTVVVGASPFAEALCALLRDEGRTTAVVDASRRRLERLRGAGFKGYLGDARTASIFEEVGIESDTMVLAATQNDELNLLVAELVHEEFGVHHPTVVQQNLGAEFGVKRRAWVDLLGEREVDLTYWNRQLEQHEAQLLTLALDRDGAADALREASRELDRQLVLVCGWKGAQPTFAKVLEGLAGFQRVTVLVGRGEASTLLAPFDASVDDGPAADEDPGLGDAPTPEPAAS